jgi:hypothetical protein
MTKRRYWVYAGLFTLISINYMDRIALSVAAKPLSEEFGLSPIQLGYLLSSFLWTYVTIMIPMAWAGRSFRRQANHWSRNGGLVGRNDPDGIERRRWRRFGEPPCHGSRRMYELPGRQPHHS